MNFPFPETRQPTLRGEDQIKYWGVGNCYTLRGEDQIQLSHQIEEFQCPHQNHRRLEEKAMVGISSEGEAQLLQHDLDQI